MTSTPELTSSLGPDQHQLMLLLIKSGGHAGNVTLQRQLGWEDDRYWRVRDSLVDLGILQRGRGKGGSVKVVGLIEPSTAATEVEATTAPTRSTTEDDLYEPVAKVFRTDWASDNRFADILVEITAKQGRRPTGGTWTRPDIVIAAVRVFPYVPGRHFDLITVEVKPLWGMDLTAVYEALAHRRAATQAYVWFHVEDTGFDPEDERVRAIVAEADRHGVGVIVASDPTVYDTWDTLADARRVAPDPEALSEFIAIQLTDDAKQRLSRWVR